jgi:TRAP-type C4-dicarboxylate transport system permease small subunit
VFLIVGAVFMSAAAIQANRGHVAIEVLAELLSPRANTIRLLLVDVAGAVFCGYFAWKSWTLLHEAVEENYHSGSTWGPPLWIPYSLMSVGMSLLTLQMLLQTVHELRRPEPRK